VTEMYEHTRKKLLKLLKTIKKDWVIYRGFTREEIATMEKEIKELECSTYEVI